MHFSTPIFKAIRDLDPSPATNASLKDAETKILDASMTGTVLHQIKLETQLSDMQQKLEKMTDNLEETMEQKVENLVKKVLKGNN